MVSQHTAQCAVDWPVAHNILNVKQDAKACEYIRRPNDLR